MHICSYAYYIERFGTIYRYALIHSFIHSSERTHFHLYTLEAQQAHTDLHIFAVMRPTLRGPQQCIDMHSFIHSSERTLLDAQLTHACVQICMLH